MQVYPHTAEVAARFPPMAGHTTRDGDDVCFVPRFAFMEGAPYAVTIGGAMAAVLVRPARPIGATTEVLSIHPLAQEVPRNLLRCYVVFSASMGEGYAREHLRLVDDHGAPLHDALLSTEYELWDGAHRRLTVLLDPARIKRGLAAHRHTGYPIRIGQPFRLVVDAAFRDARGAPLRSGAEKHYDVVADERRRVMPEGWVLCNPSRQSLEPLDVQFDRPLDYGLLNRCLHVVDPAGRRIAGAGEVGPAERSWRLRPAEPWSAGPHELVIDDVLEDLAGNSVTRVFDRDQTRPTDAIQEKRPFAMTFFPR